MSYISACDKFYCRYKAFKETINPDDYPNINYPTYKMISFTKPDIVLYYLFKTRINHKHSSCILRYTHRFRRV